jgi:hypothetical protein
MTESHLSSKLTTPVWAAFRRRCCQFLAIGYQGALPRIQNEPDEETDITGYICEALEDWFLRNPKEAAGYFVKDDPPLGKSGRTGKRRPRTDIIIGYAAGVRPEFFWESKRLHRKKATASRYTGSGGMGCFISGLYAKNYHEVAMLGYVQTDTLEQWQAELKERVKSEAKDLNLENMENSMKVDSAFPLQWVSVHHRDQSGAIRIFHFLLDCRKLPSPC